MCRQRFLRLQAVGKQVDDPCDLRQPHDLSVRHVAHMGAADDRHHVVLAMAVEGDVAHHDHVVIALHVLERAPQIGERILFVAGEHLPKGFRHAGRGVEQPFALRVFPHPAQKGADRFFGFITARSLALCAGRKGGDGSGCRHGFV